MARQSRDFSPVVFANSLGAEDMVLTDIIAKHSIDIGLFSLDTGRLPQETYDLMQEVRKHYAAPLQVYFPDSALVEEYVAQHGINGFYDSVENRKGCCFVRKVEPLRRALKGKGAWITGHAPRPGGDARQRWRSRLSMQTTVCRSLTRLLDWSNKDVWAYIRQHDVPYNKLHDEFYPQLGLCTMHPFCYAGRGHPRGTLVVGRSRRTRSAGCTPAIRHSGAWFRCLLEDTC